MKTDNYAFKYLPLDPALQINTDIKAVCLNPPLTVCRKFGWPYVDTATSATRVALYPFLPCASVSSIFLCAEDE